MSNLVSYRGAGTVVTVTMDDGKVNALSMAMLGEVNAALDRAGQAGATVVLAGREGIFSAGFDLKVLRAGGPQAPALVRAGFELSGACWRSPRRWSSPAPATPSPWASSCCCRVTSGSSPPGRTGSPPTRWPSG